MAHRLDQPLDPLLPYLPPAPHLLPERSNSMIVTERECSVDGCRLHDSDSLFYVTVVDGARHGFLLGPYPTHEKAIENVSRGRELANGADPRAAWYAFGTASTKDTRKTVFGS